jgi:hypothetical protein
MPEALRWLCARCSSEKAASGSVGVGQSRLVKRSPPDNPAGRALLHRHRSHGRRLSRILQRLHKPGVVADPPLPPRLCGVFPSRAADLAPVRVRNERRLPDYSRFRDRGRRERRQAPIHGNRAKRRVVGSHRVAGRPFCRKPRGIIFQTLYDEATAEYDGATADGRCKGSHCYVDRGGTVVTGRAR